MALPNEPEGPLAALRYREFRLLWAGQVLSMMGTRMQGAALLWHLYALTQSPAALGAIGLARVIPLVTFALAGGVVADAMDRRRLMLVSQTILGLLALFLGAWTVAGLKHVWPLYVVAGLNAGVTAFDGPARQSLIPALVPRERLANALSLNTLSSQFAAIAGPAVGGLVIARFGVGPVYCINAASFLAVIGALLAMRPTAPDKGVERPRVSLTAALEGLRFMRQSRLLVSLMLLDFLATFFSSANTLLPVYASSILKVGAKGYGWLAAAPAVGSLLGALGIALRRSINRPGRVVLYAVFAYGIATVAFGVSRTFWLCFLALAATGTADTVSTVLRQTVRQLHTPDALRGRMTSINMVFFQGGPQLGELEAGLVASWLGPVVSVVSGGVGCMLTVIGVALFAPWILSYRGEESTW